jgi:hypothetical protein
MFLLVLVAARIQEKMYELFSTCDCYTGNL